MPRKKKGKGAGGFASAFLSDDRPKKSGAMSPSEYNRRSSSKNVKFPTTRNSSAKFKRKPGRGV